MPSENGGDDERQKLLQKLPNDGLEEEPYKINTDKLADETRIETLQRIFCYIMIAYGLGGGLFSFVITSTEIIS